MKHEHVKSILSPRSNPEDMPSIPKIAPVARIKVWACMDKSELIREIEKLKVRIRELESQLK